MATVESLNNVYDVQVDPDTNTITVAYASLGAGTATASSGQNILSGDGTYDQGDGTAFKLHDAAAAGSTTIDYVGTATDQSGNVVGFLATNGVGTYYLLTNSSYAIGSTLSVVLSNGPTDTTADNWSLTSGSAVAYCFVEGTAIRTPSGDVPVEKLSKGNLVCLSDGRVAPIRWLGLQTVSTRFSDKLTTFPILIKEGALGDGMPQKDLRLSSDHALLVDGIMIQAGALVNEVSILRDTNMPPTFIYYHVELDDHSFIIAENVPAETFIDNVDRRAFDNWAEHEALDTDYGTLVELSYPRVQSHRQVPARVRRRLSSRAEMLYGQAALSVA